MPSKNKPLNEKDLEAYEATRDLAAELLQSVREMKADQVHVVTSPVIEARNKTGLSQSRFAALLGISAHIAGMGARSQAAEWRSPHFAGNRQ